jgi:uncharacterized protein
MMLTVIFLGSIVIYLATFTDAARKLIELVTPPPAMNSETARIELSRLMLPYTEDSFIRAAETGDIRAVYLFLTAGMDPNVKYGNALSHAVRAGHTEVVRVLVQAKARFGGSELSDAMEQTDIYQILLENDPAPDAINQAFIAAASRGLTSKMDILLQKGANLKLVGEDAFFKASMANTWNRSANEEGINQTVLFLLKRGIDVNTKGTDKHTALHLAAKSGFPIVIQTLLKHGANVNALTTNGRTALMDAVDMRNSGPKDKESAKIVDILLANGADINTQSSNGDTALRIAVRVRRDEAIVQKLLDAGAVVEQIK